MMHRPPNLPTEDEVEAYVRWYGLQSIQPAMQVADALANAGLGLARAHVAIVNALAPHLAAAGNDALVSRENVLVALNIAQVAAGQSAWPAANAFGGAGAIDRDEVVRKIRDYVERHGDEDIPF